MKAMVYHEYGSPDNLELQEVEMPVVKDDEVLVKVHAASVNWHDWHFLTGTPFMARIMAGGLLKPNNNVLGSDVAGRVEAVGANVRQFRPGDEVFGSTRYVTTEFSPVLALGGLWASMTGDKKMVSRLAKPPNKEDLVFMKELLEVGKVRPVIDRRYTLREVPEALRYLKEGHARGKIVITM
jgi:NADPH:quinone reductase-like Zn-dependent oxidoreductase